MDNLSVSIVSNKINEKTDGLSRYASSFSNAISKHVKTEILFSKGLQLPKFILNLFSFFGKDLNFILQTRPVNLNRRPSFAVIHFTHQNIAAPLNFYKLKKTIVTVHDLTPLSRKNDLKISLVDRLYYKLSLMAVKNSDRVITPSECIKEDVIKYLHYPPDRIDIIHEGIDHKKFKPVKKVKKIKLFQKKNINLLYVGSEFPRKNLPRLIKAIALLKREFPNIKLIKVGEAQLPGVRATINRLIEKLNLSDDIVFAGYIEDELPQYYNQADIFVFPSLYEGFGLPPLEAMACGLPVVASDKGSFPEVLGDAALLADPYNEYDIAKKIKLVIINPKLRMQLIKKGLQHSKKYTWERCAKETIESYKKLFKQET